jgi:hypothetical protein
VNAIDVWTEGIMSFATDLTERTVKDILKLLIPFFDDVSASEKKKIFEHLEKEIEEVINRNFWRTYDA